MTLRISLLLAALLCSPLVRADIFKCVDEAGHVTYTNNKPSGKGCNTLARDQAVSSVPGSGRPAAAPSTPSNGASSGSAGFPRVDSGTQKARDTDRRRILEEELAAEQRSLEGAQKQFSEQEAVRYGDERNYQKVLDRLQPFKDKVQLHERNIEALKREIGNLR
jgi:septal ring factor EnvC (AmiA/AmiB activator)